MINSINLSIFLHTILFVIIIFNPIQGKNSTKNNLSTINFIILDNDFEKKIIKTNSKIISKNKSNPLQNKIIDNKTLLVITQAENKINLLKQNKNKLSRNVNEKLILASKKIGSKSSQKKNDIDYKMLSKLQSEKKTETINTINLIETKTYNEIKSVKLKLPKHKVDSSKSKTYFSLPFPNINKLNEKSSKKILEDLGFNNNKIKSDVDKNIKYTSNISLPKTNCEALKNKKKAKIYVANKNITIEQLLNFKNQNYRFNNQLNNITINQLLSRNNNYSYVNHKSSLSIKNLLEQNLISEKNNNIINCD